MTIVIQKEIFSMTVVAILICILCVIVGNKIKKADPYAKPEGVVLFALWLVEIADNQVRSIVRESHVKNLGPYIGTLMIYLFLCNISGLFGLNTPTLNYSVTLTFALITWVLIQYNAIKDNGIGAYLHGFFEPIFLLFIPNFFGRIAPLISMSIRLFGNILSGSIIMTLVYNATSLASNWLLGLVGINSGFNIIAFLVAPPLHAYFDVFAGFIQMFIFISLTMVLISNELKSE